MGFRGFQQFDAYFFEQITLLGDYSTNLKLDPPVVTGAIFTIATAPGFIIPWHGLNCGNRSIGKFPDPCVHAHLPRDVVHVVVVGILSDQGKHLRTVGRVIARLHITFEVGVIRPG